MQYRFLKKPNLLDLGEIGMVLSHSVSIIVIGLILSDIVEPEMCELHVEDIR